VSQYLAVTNLARARSNVAAAGTLTNITRPAILCNVIITAAGTTALTFYDNASNDTSGTKLGALPATTTVGQIFSFQSPAFTGISAPGSAGTPEYILNYSPTDIQAG
jgi:hypothetical protein